MACTLGNRYIYIYATAALGQHTHLWCRKTQSILAILTDKRLTKDKEDADIQTSFNHVSSEKCLTTARPEKRLRPRKAHHLTEFQLVLNQECADRQDNQHSLENSPALHRHSPRLRCDQEITVTLTDKRPRLTCRTWLTFARRSLRCTCRYAASTPACFGTDRCSI